MSMADGRASPRRVKEMSSRGREVGEKNVDLLRDVDVN